MSGDSAEYHEGLREGYLRRIANAERDAAATQHDLHRWTATPQQDKRYEDLARYRTFLNSPAKDLPQALRRIHAWLTDYQRATVSEAFNTTVDGPFVAGRIRLILAGPYRLEFKRLLGPKRLKRLQRLPHPTNERGQVLTVFGALPASVVIWIAAGFMGAPVGNYFWFFAFPLVACTAMYITTQRRTARAHDFVADVLRLIARDANLTPENQQSDWSEMVNAP
jgi:hypothetical protein